MIKSAFSEDCA